MTRRKKIKKVLLSLIFLSLLLTLKLNSLSEKGVNRLIFKNVTIKNVGLYQTNHWMFNNRVFQYSSHIFIRNQKPVEIDSIIMTSEELNQTFVENYFRCAVKSVKADVEIYFRITTIFSFKLSNSKRVKCNILNELKFEGIGDILVAIVNTLDFKESAIDFSDIEMGKIFFKLPKSMMNYQKPRIINIPDSKIPKIAHCLHYTYNYLDIGIEKILKWLEYQKTIGISKIILYNSDHHDILEKSVHAKYSQNFVEIRPYHINYNAICDSSRLNLLKEQDIIKYQVLADYCEELFYTRFDDPSYNSSNRWKHQKVSCNDCYTSFEHVYEFVSYYDFDEIIYPRSENMNAYLGLTSNETACGNVCKLATMNENLDLYNYIKSILNRTYDFQKPLGSLYFSNAFFLEDSYYVKKLILDLKKKVIDNETFFNSSSISFNIAIHLKFTRYYGHTFTISQQDYNHVKNIYNSYNYLTCIYDKFNGQINNRVDSTYKRFLYFLTDRDHQLGKLIHYTDNVYAIHTHFSLFHKRNSVKFYVDTNDGILTHFRSDMFKKAQERNSSILNLKIDLEYYLSLIKKYSSVCSQEKI